MNHEEVRLFHCHECFRSFFWGLFDDLGYHWTQEIVKPEGLTYCPCCGSYDSVAPGPSGDHPQSEPS